MKIRFLVLNSLFILALLLPNSVSALTMQEFKAICNSIGVKCKEHPVLQAYVGGSLDIIAALDEETNYLKKKLYCDKPSNLFRVPEIIEFMEKHQKEYANKNATLLIIRYFEEKGGC